MLARLVVAALILSGLAELASAATSPRPQLSRVISATWIAAGVVAAAWPGITPLVLAITVGVALVGGGAVKAATALLGDGGERFVLGVSGITNIAVGACAAAWPAVTVLTLAVLVGLRTSCSASARSPWPWSGAGHCLARRQRRTPGRRRDGRAGCG